jgi:hypothetical protein
MANQIQQLDGQAVTNFELNLPQQPTLPLTSGIVTYLGSDLVEDVFGRKEYRHKFSTLIPEFVNDILRTAMASGSPTFRFRLGLGNPQQTFWLPWQDHFVVHYGAIVEGISKQAGHTLEITTSDALFNIARANKTVAHKGTISSIVAAIADENQIEAVIEETSGQYLFVQNFIDDATFIRDRLVRRSVNAKGRGNYLFFIIDNVLHFHSPDYQTAVKEIQYYQEPGSNLIQVDRSQQLWDEGVSGTRIIVYDPLTGETRETLSDPSRALRYAKGIYQLSAVKGGERNIFYHLGANRPDEAKAIGQNTYEHARLNTFELNVDFDKNISTRTGDIVNLVVTPQSQKTSPWSGFYLVAGTVYTIKNNAVVMKLILRRGEIQPDLSNVVTQAANRQLVPQAEAPGQDINLAEAQSSILTKGAGDQQSDSNFSKIQNPNTPLG